jgi:hypothetical protein
MDFQSVMQLMRPVDLAREHGLSTQAIRNYEDAGILPAAERTAHGYRTYTPLHAQALRALLALVPGHGHQTATSIMRAVNRCATEEALRLIDESHGQLADVRDVRLAHHLRRGGCLLGKIAPLIAEVHSAGGVAPLESTLRDWQARLSARGRAMPKSAGDLDSYLRAREP